METKVEIADIVREEKQAYLDRFRATQEQVKALGAIENCRTAKMGSHSVECDHCHHRHTRYNSCRNRHCPKCQGSKQAHWASKIHDQFLPCRYFHIVFTIPHVLNGHTYSNQKVMYSILMQSAVKALVKVAANPKFLGASAGCLSILHTWGQNLMFHPHVHMLVPAGGLSPDGWEWIESGKKFFVPVKVLSKVFRGIFVSKLQSSCQNGRVKTTLSMENLKQQLYATNWNVYSKKVFGGPGQVLTYLGRYTHRVAISNNRIISYKEGKVCFRWKDYRLKHNPVKIIEISSLEFIRRFMLHVLPNNFYKIRYAGIFANKMRQQTLEKCSFLFALLLGQELNMDVNISREEKCPVCLIGKLVLVAVLPKPET